MKHVQLAVDLYPDLLSAGGLAAGLRQALVEVGSPLKVHTLDEAPGLEQARMLEGFVVYARVEREDRFSQVYIASGQRMFLYDFWQRGVMLANAATPELRTVALSIHQWIAERASTPELAERHPVVQPTESASAFESGIEVDYRWNDYEKWIPKTFPELVSFFEAAKQTPELRRLFPFTSLNRMCFSRCTGYPYTDDCPVVGPQFDDRIDDLIPGQYEVRTRQNALLGIGNARQATEIVLRHLPLNCGHAVSGTAETIGKLSH